MTTEFRFSLFNTPGVLAELGSALGGQGINVEALVAMSLGERAELHLVLDDAEAAARALTAYGVTFRQREVMEVPVADQPGALGRLADLIAEAGGNIDAAYMSTRGTVILAVNDLGDAAAIARRLGVGG